MSWLQQYCVNFSFKLRFGCKYDLQAEGMNIARNAHKRIVGHTTRMFQSRFECETEISHIRHYDSSHLKF